MISFNEVINAKMLSSPSYVKLAGKKCQIIDNKINNYNYVTKKIEYKDNEGIMYHRTNSNNHSPEKNSSLSRTNSQGSTRNNKIRFKKDHFSSISNYECHRETRGTPNKGSFINANNESIEMKTFCFDKIDTKGSRIKSSKSN